MKRTAHGFTLVEVLVAIFIGALVLTSVYGVFGSVSKTRNRLEMEGDLYHQARIFFDRIGGELGSLRMAPLGAEAVFSSGETTAGVFFLEFNTELVSPLLQKYGGISRVRYEVQRGEESVQLLRSEKVLLADMAASEPQLFIADLSSFQVRYYSQGDWSDSWTNLTPPQMLEVTLELNADDQVIPFRSRFVLSGVSG